MKRRFFAPDYSPMFRAVIYRALFDALGFTGLNSKDTQAEHVEAVSDAREWFLGADADGDFDWVCLSANLDARRIRSIAVDAIYARTSGDYTNVPSFWAAAFRRNRAPALSWLQKQIADTPVDEHADPL